MLVSKIGQFNRIDNSKSKNLQRNNRNDNSQDVSFNGLGSFFKSTFKRRTASTGKYPVDLRDLKLRLAKQKDSIRAIVEDSGERGGTHKWVNEFVKGTKNLLREVMFTKKGKKLSRVTTYEPTSGLKRRVLSFNNDGKSFDELEIYKDGVKTKSVHFENNKRKSVTNYGSQQEISGWTDYEPDGKTIKSVNPIRYTSLF